MCWYENIYKYVHMSDFFFFGKYMRFGYPKYSNQIRISKYTLQIKFPKKIIHYQLQIQWVN